MTSKLKDVLKEKLITNKFLLIKKLFDKIDARNLNKTRADL